ncbi:hypothetical protein COOONC_13814, partial [Cooperia oncophora]
NMPFFMRWTWTMIWFRLTMYRYCAIWLIIEGAAILNGLGIMAKIKMEMIAVLVECQWTLPANFLPRANIGQNFARFWLS